MRAEGFDLLDEGPAGHRPGAAGGQATAPGDRTTGTVYCGQSLSLFRAGRGSHHAFRTDGATHVGPPTEKNESPTSGGMIDRREIVSSGSLVGPLYLLVDEVLR